MLPVERYFIEAEALAQDGEEAERVAIDLGFGEPRNCLYLLQNGWRVNAIDVNAAACRALSLAVPDNLQNKLTVSCADFVDVSLPQCSLMHAGYSLQYVTPSQFDEFWTRLTCSLLPTGIFVGQFFGKDDDFSKSNAHSTFDLDSLRNLFNGWEIIRLDEYKGPGERSPERRWHFYTIIARARLQRPW